MSWYEEIFEPYLEDEYFYHRVDNAVDKCFKKWLAEEKTTNPMTFRWSSWSKFVNVVKPIYRVTLR